MAAPSRRAFLRDLGLGAVAAAAAPTLLRGFGPGRPWQDEAARITFGALEPLATLMQERSADELLPVVVAKLRDGVSLREVVAAGALANARVFGGEDYTGYHCAMALMPAWRMASRASDPRLAPLPVLKVLHRNTTRIQQFGGTRKETLVKVAPAAGAVDASSLVEAERRPDVDLAERVFARCAEGGDLAAFEALQALVRDNVDVHQVVLAWSAWDLLQATGREHAHVLLRQSLRHCVSRERGRIRSGSKAPAIRTLLPALVEEHGLDREPKRAQALDDAAFERLSRTCFAGSQGDAARAVAAALAAGSDPEAVGEAISLAAVRLVLHDPGARNEAPGKPIGSVHGASVGVHASDSAHAWRNIARVASHRTRMASLVTAAWHTAGQARSMDVDVPFNAASRAEVASLAARELPAALETAIRERAQGRAVSLVERYGALDQPSAPLIDLLLTHAVTHDGALHNEKFFRAAVASFETTRAAFRWFHLAGLARVCASSFGFDAPGLVEARRLLTA